MILLFPNLDVVHLALSGGAVGPDVALAPAAVSFDATGRPHVEPSVALPKAAVDALKRLGVKASRKHAADPPADVADWVQILPVVRDPAPPALSSQAPVLFELQSADDLPAVAGEMLRLGNDRQGVRWFADGGATRALLRVVGPPYYSLLRALERSPADAGHGVRAYLERAPRLWVEVGYTHPLVDRVKVPDGQFCLVRPPREWVRFDDSPFRDIYDVVRFDLPAGPREWEDADPSDPLEVPLRLVAGNAADVPELWVLRGADAVGQLDAFVRDAADTLTGRLTFAVADDPAGGQLVVLRTRPSKLAPPVVPLDDAVGYKPFYKLPNLFVPAGRRLHPTLRRDAVRKLLAVDPDDVVWLAPAADGRAFTPESLPDAAFRPLADWVEYVIEADRRPLAAWIGAARFDFDHFICKDKSAPDADRTTDAAPRPKVARDDGPVDAAPQAVGTDNVTPPPPDAAPFTPTAEGREPNQWLVRRKELEDRFVQIGGPLDSPERLALWPQLAEASGEAGDAAEAAVGWLNALWLADDPPAGWVAGWVRSEAGGDAPVWTADDFDRALATTAPEIAVVRAFVANLLAVGRTTPTPAWLTKRLQGVQQFLNRHERVMPVRAAWLAAHTVSRLAGADVLGLAQVRDRLLQRLLDEGLSPERDLPTFLRYAGHRDSDRLRAARGKALQLHAAVRRWTATEPVNLPFVDLLFSFGLARLGESIPARKLLDDARAVMTKPGKAAPTGPAPRDSAVVALTWATLFRAFQYRIEQALGGEPHAGPLAGDAAAAIGDLSATAKGEAINTPPKLAEYAVIRLQEQSRVLEPQERVYAYGQFTAAHNPLIKELAALTAVREPSRFTQRVRDLHRGGVPGLPIGWVRFMVLREVIPLAARVGEDFTVELVRLVPAAVADAATVPDDSQRPADFYKLQAELLERALFAAAHFDRGDLVSSLTDEVVGLVRGKPDAVRYEVVNVVAGQCVRSLRRLGLRDEIDRLLGRLRAEVLKGATVADLRRQHAAKPDEWVAVLQALLNLAGGWLAFGFADQAVPILDEARNVLLGPLGAKVFPQPYTKLARAYVSALGLGPSEHGFPRIAELFEKMDPNRITNKMTTAASYSRLHLNLVEDVVLALTSDDFGLGPAGRRWLEDDEYLVRRRIHRDTRRHLERAGL